MPDSCMQDRRGLISWSHPERHRVVVTERKRPRCSSVRLGDRAEVADGLDRLLVHVAGLRGGRDDGHVQRHQRAALLTPTFLIGFPLFSVPRLTLVAAIGTSLFLEASGFGTGLLRYFRATN